MIALFFFVVSLAWGQEVSLSGDSLSWQIEVTRFCKQIEARDRRLFVAQFKAQSMQVSIQGLARMKLAVHGHINDYALYAVSPGLLDSGIVDLIDSLQQAERRLEDELHRITPITVELNERMVTKQMRYNRHSQLRPMRERACLRQSLKIQDDVWSSVNLLKQVVRDINTQAEQLFPEPASTKAAYLIVSPAHD